MHRLEININADLGEMAGQDEFIMPYLDFCNIATGGHIGNVHSIQKTIELAQQHTVKIGAHPSYPDRENFGRIRPNISDSELLESITSQLSLFYEVAAKNAIEVHHIKPHGALYHDVVNNERTAELFLTVLDHMGLKTSIFTLKSGFLHQIGKKKHKIYFEAFIDRRYTTEINLVDRKHPQALIMEPNEVWKQLYSMMYLKKIDVISGERIDISADTFCLHGDHPNATEILKYIYEHLETKKS